jgi:hypothetical protein
MEKSDPPSASSPMPAALLIMSSTVDLAAWCRAAEFKI